ncbi:MAG: cupredoxin domain-containing protein [Gaiellaceae bacterium]
MKVRSLTLALLTALVALSFAPVASPTGAAPSATTVTVTMKEFKFVLSKKTVRHGTVTFKLVNKGKLPHDFKIAGKKSPLVGKGKTRTFKVKLAAGVKPYVCTLAGHAAAGMKGKLKVT